MSSVLKKMKKKNTALQKDSDLNGSVKKLSDDVEVPPSTTESNTRFEKLLNKLCDAELSRHKLNLQVSELSSEICDTLKFLLDCGKATFVAERTLEQKLQQMRHDLQATQDELSDTQKLFNLSQKENTQLKENLQGKQVELQMIQDELATTTAQLKQAQEENEELRQRLQAAQDELNRVEERIRLQDELEHIEREIARYEEIIKSRPEKRKFYESQLAGYEKAFEQCLVRLEELEGNFKPDSSFELQSEESGQSFLEQINQRDPTDEVILRSYEDELRLLNIWKTSDYVAGVPDDLIRAGTLSLEDFIITFEPENFSARVVFSSNNDYSLGAIIFTDSPKTTLSIFFITAKDDNLILTSHEQNVECGDIFLSGANRVLHVWYGIETALLNPVVRDRIIGNRPVESVDTEHQRREDNKVAYIKRVPITVDDLLGEVDPKSFERHADKWGVKGFWRQCASGKKVWVKPHERGPKRGQKLENQNLRERIIVTEH